MNHATPALRARICALIAEIAQVDDGTLVGAERLREDLGMDSLGSMELLSRISAELRLDIEAEEAMDIQTVDDACAFVARRVQEGSGHDRAPSA